MLHHLAIHLGIATRQTECTQHPHHAIVCFPDVALTHIIHKPAHSHRNHPTVHRAAIALVKVAHLSQVPRHIIGMLQGIDFAEHIKFQGIGLAEHIKFLVLPVCRAERIQEILHGVSLAEDVLGVATRRQRTKQAKRLEIHHPRLFEQPPLHAINRAIVGILGVQLQKKATVLVNPRTNQGEYTKYSFPSKTMEYMASGRPVMMFRLDGIPGEYDPFLTYIPEESAASIRDTAESLRKLSPSELDEMGARGREFVLKNKNRNVQMRRVLDFIHKEQSDA